MNNPESGSLLGGPSPMNQSNMNHDHLTVDMKAQKSTESTLYDLHRNNQQILRSAQQLILINGIIGSAHYACFVPSVLESITLQSSSNSLKYLSLFAGFNTLNGFHALLVLPKLKRSGRRMVQYLAFSNVLSIAASVYLHYKKPNVVKQDYLMLSAAVNGAMLSMSLYMIPKLRHIDRQRQQIVDNNLLHPVSE